MHQYNQCIITSKCSATCSLEVQMTELRMRDDAIHDRRSTLLLVGTATVGLAIVIASIVIDHRAHVGP